MGNLALPLLDTPVEAHHAIIFIILMNKRDVLHERRFSAVPIVARPFNPFGGRDDHDSGAGHFSGRAHSNAFFATTLLHLNRWSNDHRRYILPPTLTHQ